MASILAFGRYLPERRMGNEELASRLGCEAAWIRQASGIEERRLAGPEETVVEMGVAAGKDCLAHLGGRIPGLILVASGTGENRFPGPAAAIGLRLGFAGVPAIDLPLASSGGLFGIALGAASSAAFGDVLVIATEKMSGPASVESVDRGVAILFGDAAGACWISAADTAPGLRFVDSALHSDGTWIGDLRLGLTGPLQMDGLSVILQASRKIPAAIEEVLGRNGLPANAVRAYLMHQANQNLTDRVARALGVPAERFYSNIRRYGNTSSASLLVAASEWFEATKLLDGDPVCFATFGAGFHWGAVLTRFRG